MQMHEFLQQNGHGPTPEPPQPQWAHQDRPHPTTAMPRPQQPQIRYVQTYGVQQDLTRFNTPIAAIALALLCAMIGFALGVNFEASRTNRTLIEMERYYQGQISNE